MSDPKRWLEGNEASSDEKALLRSGLKTEASSETVDEIWACLAALPTGGAGPEGGASASHVAAKGASPSGSLGALGAKLALGTILLAGAGLGLWLGRGRGEGPVQAIAPDSAVLVVEPELTKPVAQSPEEAVEKPKQEDLPKAAPKLRVVKAVEENRAPAQVPVPEKPKESSPANDLLEESRALEASRNSISRGDYGEAVRGLEAMEARFPKGILGQEREALRIEALWKSGDKQIASQRAADFFRRFPDSPHGARLRRFISSP